jgi:DNA (cytosine-5)-methyltransferase 1
MSRPVLTVGSLFAGIGGIELGLERAGMRTVWQVEKDDFARRVLAKHWPDARRHDDVCTFPPGDPDDWRCDLICGGFPCQDISFAGRGAGLAGKRSGLWSEFARIVGVLRPRYVLVENVAALLVRGMDAVLGTLASLGYDAEWHVIPAAAVGAPHLRERVFILAYAESGDAGRAIVNDGQRSGQDRASDGSRLRDEPGGRREALGNTNLPGLAFRPCLGGDARTKLATSERANREGNGQWAVEPDVGRVAHGVSNRVARLRCLGNAVVPQVAQFIGERIMEMES